MTGMYHGYTESAEQIADRWQRIKAKSFACDVYGEELTDAEAAALRWALELAETEDEREAQNREAAAITDWLQANNAAGQYGERAYIILSLVAKSLLAWQVFAGTLRP